MSPGKYSEVDYHMKGFCLQILKLLLRSVVAVLEPKMYVKHNLLPPTSAGGKVWNNSDRWKFYLQRFYYNFSEQK